jgi:hypothetical protein
METIGSDAGECSRRPLTSTAARGMVNRLKKRSQYEKA